MNLRIKYLRENARLTQKELGARVGISPGNLSKYELGQLEPNLTVIQKLSEFFDVSSDFLLGLSDNPNASKKGAESDSDAPHDYVYVMGANGIRQRFYIPPEKADRFMKLIEAGLPEIFEK